MLQCVKKQMVLLKKAKTEEVCFVSIFLSFFYAKYRCIKGSNWQIWSSLLSTCFKKGLSIQKKKVVIDQAVCTFDHR